MTRSFLPCLFLILFLLPVTGCSGVGHLSRMFPFSKKPITATAANPAVEVACMWQPGEGRNEKGIPCRGFSGQVLFFDRKHSEPVLVDGTVRFYLFADGKDSPADLPIKQFDFTPEAWNLHATQTAMGPGYSVFLPYPSHDQYQTRGQVRLRFAPKLGPTIYSEAVTLTLEGPPRPGGASPPATVANATIDRRSVPAHELYPIPDPSNLPAGRRLRTDTYRYDPQVRGVTHEQLAARGQPNRLPETAALPISHPLLGGQSSPTAGSSSDIPPGPEQHPDRQTVSRGYRLTPAKTSSAGDLQNSWPPADAPQHPLAFGGR